MKGQDNRGRNGTHEAFQQIGAKAGYVPHIVPHVICNCCRIAGIILGNSGFSLAHQIGTHISCLGVNAAANAEKHSDNRAAQSIAGNGHGEGRKLNSQPVPDQVYILNRELLQPNAEYDIDYYQAEQGKAADTKTHDGTAFKGDLEGLTQFFGSPCCI